MFKSKTPEGRRNLCGSRISEYRRRLNLSQNKLAIRLQLAGMDIHKNTIQRIEAGKAYVTDIEICYFAHCLECKAEDLLDISVLKEKN